MHILMGLTLWSSIAGLPSPEQQIRLAKGESKIYTILSLPQVPHAYDALHYRFDIQVDVVGDSIIARAEEKCVSLADTLSTYLVHLVGLTVDSVRVNGQLRPFSRPDSTLLVDLGSPIAQGDTFIVEIFYHGHPLQGGGVFGGGLSIGSNLIYADNEPFGIKRWLPILDDPSEKATVDFWITVPSGFKVVANGTLMDSSLSGPWWTYHWAESYPISPYLIVLAGSPNYAVWEEPFVYEADTMPLLTAVYTWDSSMVSQRTMNLPDMITYFSNTFGTYPFIQEKYGHVHAPIGGAMENQTNTFINVTAGWGGDWDWVISHELGHQWWGDWVTLGDWRDIWLNEGFASYCEALWYGHREGPDAYRSYMQQVIEAAINYEPFPPYPMYDPENLFSWGVVYRKGASVLHMLRHVVGDSIFFEILRTYGQTYGYGNAVTTDFQAVAEAVSGQDLGWFFTEWVFEPGHPKYQWGWADISSGNSYAIYVVIQQVQSHAYGVPTFKMPIDLVVQTTTGDTTVVVWDSLDLQEFTIPLNAQPLLVQFDPYPWIMREAQQTPIFERGQFHENLSQLRLVQPLSRHLRWIGKVPKGTLLTVYAPDGRRIFRVRDPRNGLPLHLPPGLYFFRFEGPLQHPRTLKAIVIPQ